MECQICGAALTAAEKDVCEACSRKVGGLSLGAAGLNINLETIPLGGRAEAAEDAAPPSDTAAANATIIREFGREGAAALRNPFSVALDNEGNILVMDTPEKNAYRVLMFSPAGEFVRVALDLREGQGTDQLKFPKGIATDSAGNIYIPDAGNNRIQRFNAAGEPLGPVGTAGQGPGEFDFPCDVDVDDAGMLYVADTFNNRIQKLTPQGVMLLCIGDAGEEEEAAGAAEPEILLGEPVGVTCDADKNIYVADTNNDRLLKFDPAGRLLMTLGGGKNGVEFAGPSDVRVMSDGVIFVADRDNTRIHKFTPAGRRVAEFALDLGEQAGIEGGDVAIDTGGMIIMCNIIAHTVLQVQLKEA